MVLHIRIFSCLSYLPILELPLGLKVGSNLVSKISQKVFELEPCIWYTDLGYGEIRLDFIYIK